MFMNSTELFHIDIEAIYQGVLTLGVGASSVEARVVKTCSRPRVNADTSGGGLVEGISCASVAGAVPVAAAATTDGGIDGRREGIFRSNTEGIGGGGKRKDKVLGIGSVGGGGGGGAGAVGKGELLLFLLVVGVVVVVGVVAVVEGDVVSWWW